MERSAQIVSLITGVSFDDAFSLLKEVKDPRITALMIKKKISKEEAERLLKKFDYNFRIAYES
jgi:N-acetylmuramic acid 6-phosphate (MurNAc-6-P) etherase